MKLIPDFSSVPERSVSTTLSSVFSTAVMMTVFLCALFFVVVPWYNETDISVTSRLLQDEKFGAAWNISKQADEFISFLNPEILLAVEGQLKGFMSSGVQCNISVTNFDPQTQMGHLSNRDDIQLHQISDCAMNCEGRTFGGRGISSQQNDAIFNGSSVGGCTLGNGSSWFVSNHDPYLVFRFRSFMMCSNEANLFEALDSQVWNYFQFQKATPTDLVQGYYPTKMTQELYSSCWGDGQMFSATFQRLHVRRFNRFGFVVSTENAYELIRSEATRKYMNGNLHIYVMLHPLVFYIDVKPDGLLDMFARLAGLMGISKVLLILSRSYNTYYAKQLRSTYKKEDLEVYDITVKDISSFSIIGGIAYSHRKTVRRK